MGPKFLHAALAQTPLILALKVVFGKLLPVPKLCKKFLAQCASMMTGTVCFEEKTTICNAKFGDLGDKGDMGSKYVVESAIFGIADPDLPIHYATFMGLQWWLRAVYSWVPPLLSIFGRKKTKSRFGPKFDGFRG